ncbi:uncharacterized protein LOC119093013 isoform X2 [Pollicipes pollicipes]|uniref:uncharacterized protein LOC119093013 isoform X2 n=1 Tax=Pollicipes pollicipes TaxID=41117 RepID=UPI0018859E26|nr:uncharacterized protein LOC119093013 isoform X2 [Pollicipes pollicipes]
MKLLLIVLGLLSLWRLPSGDAANLSRRSSSLEDRPRRNVSVDHSNSSGNKLRGARSVLAARVVDERGNTVHLRSTGHPPSRRIVKPFVTSSGGRPSSSGRVTSSRGRVTSSRGVNRQLTVGSRPSGGQRRRFSPSAQARAVFSPAKKQNIAPKLPRTQEVVHSVYPQAYESHEGVNARNMTLFLFRRSDRPSHYVDRTSGTGTLYTSRRGACPAMPLSGCSPLPRGGLPRSCANDYQCGDHLKCCYDPCLTINKCVRPVAG